MKKNLKTLGTVTLLLIVILSTSILPVTNSKAFASSTFNLDSNNKPLPEAKPEYYTNGFPDKIYVGEENISTPEYVVIDLVFDEVVKISDGIIEYTEHGGTWNHPDFDQVGFIAPNGMTASTVSGLPNRTVAAGEIAFSAILRPNNKFFNLVKVKNKHYWNKILSVNLSPTSSTTFVQTEKHGVTNTEALTLAKSSGTSFSIGVDLSKGPISAKFGYETSQSLTRTFGRTISINESTEVQIRHTFESDDTNRRVALYQYYEEFEILPNFSSYWIDILYNYYHCRAVIPKNSELKTNAFAGLEVKEQ